MDDTNMILTCSNCLTKNRIPAERAGEDPNCGKCGQPLLAGIALHLTDENFDRVTKNTDLPILVDFWAPWCGPCKSMEPAYDKAAKELKGKALLVKVNSDDNPKSAMRFRIRSIPTLVKLEKGEEVSRKSGSMPASAIVSFAVL